MSRSPYLRDRLAMLPAFANRERQLPMTPEARAKPATFARLPKHDRAKDFAARGLPPFLASVPSAGDLIAIYDDSVPDGFVEIDGVRISLEDLQSCVG